MEAACIGVIVALWRRGGGVGAASRWRRRGAECSCVGAAWGRHGGTERGGCVRGACGRNEAA